MSLSPLKPKSGPKSIKLYFRVIRQTGISMAGLGFLAVMKTFRGELGIIPSAETMAQMAGVNRKTVFTYLKELKALGLVKVVSRYLDGKRTSNCYLIEDEQMAVKLAINSLSSSGENGTRPLRPEKRDSSTFEQDGRLAEGSESNVIPLPVDPEQAIRYPKPARKRRRGASAG